MKLLKMFAKYVSLNVLGMLALSCYILADTFFIAQGLGADGLTALNLAIPIYSFINGCGLMIGIGGGTRYSILQAGGNDAKASRVFSHSLFLGTVFAFIFILIGILGVEQLTLLLGADENVFDMTFIYLKVMLFFSPAFILNNIMIAFVRNDGSPGLSMAAMAVGSFANILFDYIFIFPCELGMFGAILATGFSPLFGLIILSRHFFRKGSRSEAKSSCLRLVRFRPSLQTSFDVFSLGASSLITEVASGLVIIIFNLIILDLSGNIGVAAYGIIANLSLVVTAIFTGIAQGLQPLLSQAHGNQQYENVRYFFRLGIFLSLVLSILVYVFMVIFHSPIIALFNKSGDSTLAAIARSGFYIYFTAFLFAGVNIINATYFSCVDKPVPAFVISILRGFVIIIPCIIILSRMFGMTGVWLSFPVAEALTLVVGTKKGTG